MQIKSMGCGLAACALLFWSIGPAAAEGPYLSLRGGVTFLQDADLIVEECSALIEQHGLDRKVARDVVTRAMLGDQPLPLASARG